MGIRVTGSKKYFATLSLQNEISTLARQLKRHGICNFSFYLLFKTGEVFLLSSLIDLCLPYYEEKMYEHDKILNPSLHQNKRYHLGSGQQVFGKHQDMIRHLSGGNIYYHLVRECCDFTVVLSTGGEIHHPDEKLFYKQSHIGVGNIVADFIFKIRGVIFERAPKYRYSKFLNDHSMLTMLLIDQLNDGTRIISDREKEVLGLSATGKTAEEISMIMGITARTVTKHRCSLVEKLNCSNITHTVFEATKRGIISEENLHLRKFDFLHRFINTDPT
jgi:DNA-binding CsgD family transcriptional regulator